MRTSVHVCSQQEQWRPAHCWLFLLSSKVSSPYSAQPSAAKWYAALQHSLPPHRSVHADDAEWSTRLRNRAVGYLVGGVRGFNSLHKVTHPHKWNLKSALGGQYNRCCWHQWRRHDGSMGSTELLKFEAWVGMCIWKLEPIILSEADFIFGTAAFCTVLPCT